METGQELLVDSDVLIEFLRGREDAVRFLRTESARVVLSVVVIAELYAGVRSGERDTFERFINAYQTAPVTKAIAQRGGLLKNSYGPSHGVGLADALLAATAMERGCRLATLNTKHYPMLPGLQRAY
jgi:hypothetical protein